MSHWGLVARQPLPEHKKKNLSWSVHVTGETRRLVTGTEVKIGTLKAADRSAGVLVEHKARDRTPADQLSRVVDDWNFRLDQGERPPGSPGLPRRR